MGELDSACNAAAAAVAALSELQGMTLSMMVSAAAVVNLRCAGTLMLVTAVIGSYQRGRLGWP